MHICLKIASKAAIQTRKDLNPISSGPKIARISTNHTTAPVCFALIKDEQFFFNALQCCPEKMGPSIILYLIQVADLPVLYSKPYLVFNLIFS